MRQLAPRPDAGPGGPSPPPEPLEKSLCSQALAIWRRSNLVVIRRVAAGAHVVREGDPATQVIGILSGASKSYKSMSDGRCQIVAFPLQGALIGLGRERLLSLSIQALEPVTTCHFPRGAFQSLVARSPGLERKLLDNASDALQSAQAQMLLLGRKSPLERVASFLRIRAAQAPSWRIAGSFTLPMSRSDIADHLGITTETVSRNITVLRTAGIIETRGATNVRIMNAGALDAVADGLLRCAAPRA